MDRIKSIALTSFAIIFGLASLGFFASVGLFIIGAFVVTGALAALAGGITSVFAKHDVETA